MNAGTRRRSKTSRSKKVIDRMAPAAFFICIAGLVLYLSATSLAEQGYASGTAITNAALYPRLLAGILMALTALQLVNDFREAETSKTTGPTKAKQLQIMQLSVGLVLYLLALPLLGYLLATPVFLLGLLFSLGDRRLATLIGVPLVITIGCLLVFQGLFNVNLPRGLFDIAVNL